ncbi:MAG: sigma-70 family RNA polymerase sigma factor [Thermaerobacter sp.]|nr:sigma-70 family RNA polymerase sigma factor [Thermaerobacter sp.]
MNGREAAYQAIERLFEQHADEIFRFARFSVGSRGAAEDIVQEVFLRAMGSWDRFAGRSSERTWLFSIARHAIADHLRRVGRQEGATDLEREIADPSQADEVARLDLEASLRLLPLAQREVFVLRIVEDRSAGETAALLGRSEVSVRVTLHRALSRLRAALAPDDAPGEREGGNL